MSHVALYSPYIPKHSGGGEKYLLSIAEVASQAHEVTILVPGSLETEMVSSLPRYAKSFGLDLSRVKVRGSSIGTARGSIKTLLMTKQFSHLFAITDGSIFPTLCPHSYLISQLPWTKPLSAASQLKLSTWESVLVYSDFVKEILTETWKSKKIKVLAPYVDLELFKPAKKTRVVLNVGRFFAHATSNSKRQDVVIEAFKRLVDKQILKDYSLVLIGNVDPNLDSEAFLADLKAQAYGYPINFLTDLGFDKLRENYAAAEYYWHATGFDVNAKEHPENTEHFGITTLEAMASGCIPMVVPNGGQREVVDDTRFFYDSIDELMEKMTSLSQLKQGERAELTKGLHLQAEKYSKSIFSEAVNRLLK